MKPKETPETVRRMKEIYRRVVIPRVTVMTGYTFVRPGKRSEIIFDKMRAGREIRDYK